jgi:hypothetical protein
MSTELDLEDFLGEGSSNLFGDQGHLPDVTEIGYGPVRSVIVSSGIHSIFHLRLFCMILMDILDFHDRLVA